LPEKQLPEKQLPEKQLPEKRIGASERPVPISFKENSPRSFYMLLT
jgi:hypothetical protein